MIVLLGLISGIVADIGFYDSGQIYDNNRVYRPTSTQITLRPPYAINRNPLPMGRQGAPYKTQNIIRQ